MIDSLIAILLGLTLVETARLGGHVSTNPPPTPLIARKYTWRFRVYALFAFLLTITQGARLYFASANAEATQTKLTGSIEDLHNQLQASDAGRREDNAYFKAKLEDYKDLQRLAPALLSIAEATKGYTQKQYESSTASKKQLLDQTDKVVKQIRDLGGKCKAQEASIFSTAAENPSPGLTQEQKQQFFVQRSLRVGQAYEKSRADCAQLYRQEIIGTASFLRNELLNRVGGDSFLTAHERGQVIALDGMFAGSDPINDSADYLEALANKYREMPPKQP